MSRSRCRQVDVAKMPPSRCLDETSCQQLEISRRHSIAVNVLEAFKLKVRLWWAAAVENSDNILWWIPCIFASISLVRYDPITISIFESLVERQSRCPVDGVHHWRFTMTHWWDFFIRENSSTVPDAGSPPRVLLNGVPNRSFLFK